VKPSSISWFWKHRIPRQGVTLWGGEGGVGKSITVLDIAARATTGRPMPDGDTSLDGPVSVVIFTAEDPLDSVVVPRLTLAGADLTRVLTISIPAGEGHDRPLMVNASDLARLDKAIETEYAKLVIFDPLVSFVAADTNMHHTQDARRIFAALHRMAERHDLAVLAIHHHNKSTIQNATMRLSGSAGIGQAARSVLMVGADPSDPTRERMILALDKRNLAPRDLPSLVFRLVLDEDQEHPHVVWDGTSPMTSQDLVALPVDPEEGSAIDEATAFLRERLESGPVKIDDLQREARKAGISERTLERAKRRLRVRSQRQGGAAGEGWWTWSLPTPQTGDGLSDKTLLQADVPKAATRIGTVERVEGAELLRMI
jgi:hypothetical protein